MKNSRTTIKDIALQAGVSIGTVDRVLHERGEVAKETQERVLRIAGEMHYRPNLMASALTAKRSYSVVAVIPNADENTYWACHLKGLKRCEQQLGAYALNVEFVFFDLQNAQDFSLKTAGIAKRKIDGVIFAPIFRNESVNFAEQLDEANIPYIFIDTYIDDTHAIGFVGEDAFQSGRVAASLVDFGVDPHKDIAMVNFAKNVANSRHLALRNSGFMSFFMDQGRNTGLKINVEIDNADERTVADKLDAVMQNSNIGAIWVSGSKAYAIAHYVETHALRDIIIVGYDVYDRNTEYLRRNIIQYLVTQQPTEQAVRALTSMFNYIAERQKPLSIEYQKIEVVNAENLRFFVN